MIPGSDRCHDVFLGVTFIFRLYDFIEAVVLRSIVLRYAGASIATHVFLSFFFLFIGYVAFSEYFCAIAVSSLYGEHVLRFFPSGWYFSTL